jgi:hypothetical protein
VPVNGVPTTIPVEPPIVGDALPTYLARVYTPSVNVVDSHTVVVTFSGYGVYDPNDNALNYRSIHSVRLTASRSIPLKAKAE